MDPRLPLPPWVPLLLGLAGVAAAFALVGQSAATAAAVAALAAGVTGWLIASRAELVLGRADEDRVALKEAEVRSRQSERALQEQGAQAQGLQAQLQAAQQQLRIAEGQAHELGLRVQTLDAENRNLQLQTRTQEIEARALQTRVQELGARAQEADERARSLAAELQQRAPAPKFAAPVSGNNSSREELEALREAHTQDQTELRQLQTRLSEVQSQRDGAMRDAAQLQSMIDSGLPAGGLDDEATALLHELNEGFTSSAQAIEETSQALTSVNGGLKGIADNVELLASNAEESASSILEMAAANDEVAESMLNLAASVQETATSIEEMTFSVKEVAKNIEALSSTAEETSAAMNEMDGSIQQVENNANETAQLSEEVVWAAEGVVFFDTLLARLSAGEVEAVLAHELGHFRHRHVQKRMVLIFGASLAGLALLGWLAGQSGFYAGLGVAPNLSAPNSALALLLFSLALPPFMFFVSPLAALLSRKHEFEADAYACAQADGRDLANALLKLHEDNAATLTPDPLYARFYYSHPPAPERLAALTAPVQALPA